jgi:hypothetical protein
MMFRSVTFQNNAKQINDIIKIYRLHIAEALM